VVASAPQLASRLENSNIKQNAVKRYILAATQGQGDDYLPMVEMFKFKEGFFSKDDLPLLFVHTRPLPMQPKVHRGR